MIPNSGTNFLYLADTLSKKFPEFFKYFEKLLKEYNMRPELLPGTKDIWARDYMPVQVSKKKFVQFSYAPSYLATPEEKSTITDTEAVCKEIGIETVKSDIILDGGSLVNSANKVIISDRVFEENPGYSKDALIEELKRLLETDDLFFIPAMKPEYDFTGHADGMVRFIDDNTILINDYKKEYDYFKKAFYKAIEKTGLKHELIPYNPYGNRGDDARGIYINYLEIGNLIFMPTFEMKEDKEAIKRFEDIFIDKTILPLDSREVAKEGGILNCISWNILK